MSESSRAPRRICADLPAAEGRFESSVDDFEVEEVPLYLPSGDGEHLYLTIEKAGLTTRDVVRRACEVFGVNERDVGTAGLKDKHATTRQTISVLGAAVGDASRLEGEGLRVLSAALHGNKLRTGHLSGNRFRVTLRDVPQGHEARVQAVLDRLSARGLPNFYGAQRFGRDDHNLQQARRVLQKGPRAAGGKWKARFLVSALQSALFNDVLLRRIDAGTEATVLAGDVLMKNESGGRFASEDPAVDQPRHDAWEVSISGPIFGPKMHQPTPGSEPAAIEEAVLAEAELDISSFARLGKLAQGTRRPFRAPVGEPSVGREGDLVHVRFTLPPGAYATVLIGELLA